MSDPKTPILTLNPGRVWLPYIAAASEAKRREKRADRLKTIEIELLALETLNSEYANSSGEDRHVLDELNAHGEDLKRERAALHAERTKPLPFWGIAPMSLSAHDAAHAILRGAREPLHYRDITDRMLGSGLWVSHGDTPWSTVNSAIRTEMKRRGSASRFVEERRGIYGLREWTDPDEA